MGSIPIVRMKTEVPSRCCHIFSVLPRSRQFARAATRRHLRTSQKLLSAPDPDQRATYIRGTSVSQPMFLNRQTLYLRPDPARVVVRPFKPATEPRDLNPTDKTRANHIVDQSAGARCRTPPTQQLKDVLENFEGRHRNLLEIFETACCRDGRRTGAACRL